MELQKEVNNNIKCNIPYFLVLNIFISFAPTENSEYGLVMEYADKSLNLYLKEHFDKLTWDDKYELALQLANAVSYLHEEDIVHCNLVIHLFCKLLFNHSLD